jgi:tricorn protease
LAAKADKNFRGDLIAMRTRIFNFQNLIRPALLLICICLAAPLAAASPHLPIHSVAMNQDSIVFSYAGDLWKVAKSGGVARQVTKTPGEREYYPVFSSDGSKLAFAREAFDNWDVYLREVATGAERRLTYHPKLDFPCSWSPDGTTLFFASPRESDNYRRLYSLKLSEANEQVIALPMAYTGSLSPDGRQLAYVPGQALREYWRNYRGGALARIRIVTLQDASEELLPNEGGNDWNPIWTDHYIYFLSDRRGTTNLFRIEVSSRRIEQLTRFEKYDVRAFAITSDGAVIVQDGRLHVLDLRTKELRPVAFTVDGTFPESQPRTVPVQRNLQQYSVSGTDNRILLGARGEVILYDPQSKIAENLTHSSGVAEREAKWSPDGKAIAFFSDASGEYQLHIRRLDGQEEIIIPIETKPTFYLDLVWSPDSRKITFSDKRLNLWYVDVATRKPQVIDTSIHADQHSFQAAWSTDSSWIAYSKRVKNHIRTVYLYSFQERKASEVSDSRDEATHPVFDRNGRYLYFASSRLGGAAATFGLMQVLFSPHQTHSLWAVALQEGVGAPSAIEAQAPASSGIKVAGIQDRLFRLPTPSREITQLMAGPPGKFFYLEADWDGALTEGRAPVRRLVRYDTLTSKPESWAEDIFNPIISSDGLRLAYRQRGRLAIVSSIVVPQSGEGLLDLGAVTVAVNSLAEWRQIYFEAWRLQRDYFWDSNLHGQNLDELRSHYLSYLENVRTREELNQLFAEMFAHLSVSHLQIGGGDTPGQRGEEIGLLGADYEIVGERFRFKRVMRGDSSRALTTSPLRQSGNEVGAGEYLLAVDGMQVTAARNLFSYFIGKSGKPISLTVGPTTTAAGSRTVTVIPISGENGLRTLVWQEENARKVAELSNGRLGYIYIPDTGYRGFQAFMRDFYANVDKEGLIVDERFNGGGYPADVLIEILQRRPLSAYAFREGINMPFPAGFVPGPKIMITNEEAGSGGDTLPWMFRRAGVGKLIGKRTMGAGIGGIVNLPAFIDGGSILAPNRAFFDARTGELSIENFGVQPDIEVGLETKAWREGRDSQLEKAVSFVLDELKRNPKADERKPKYPSYR